MTAHEVLEDADWDWLLTAVTEGDGVHGDDPADLRRLVRLGRLREEVLGRRSRVSCILPAVAFCGWGRCGKDTAAQYLARATPLRYAGSMSWHGKRYVAARLGLSEQEAWDTRHQRRQEWKDLLNEYRAGDPTRLLRDLLAHAHLVPGTREAYEITAGREQRLLAHVVWIHRPGVPRDFTVAFGPELCDVVIENGGPVEEFREKLRAWAASVKIPLRS